MSAQEVRKEEMKTDTKMKESNLGTFFFAELFIIKDFVIRECLDSLQIQKRNLDFVLLVLLRLLINYLSHNKRLIC